MKNTLNTTRVRNVVRMSVAAGVGTLITWGSVKWLSLNAGTFAFAAPAIAAAYFAAIHWAEVKFPKFGWLLGLLPQKKSVAPTPAPVKAVAKKATAAKKPAPKK
jgi:hypothetical protein